MPFQQTTTRSLPTALLKLTFLFVGLVGCLFVASISQNLNAHILMIIPILLLAIGLFTYFFGISLKSSIWLLALFFLKPGLTGYFAIIGFLLFLLLVELKQNNCRNLYLANPLAVLILVAFGIHAVSKVTVNMGYTYFTSTVLVPLVCLLLFSNIKINRQTIIRWMQAITLIGVIVGLYGTVTAIMNPMERLGSFWVTAMTINGFYTVAFFFGVALSLNSNIKLHKRLYALASLIIFLGMLYTYTRMAILAVIFGFFLLMIKLRTMRYAGIAFMLVMPLLIPSSMASRIEMSFNYDISLIIRFVAWYYAIGQIIAHPFTGLGFSVWSTWYRHIIPISSLYAQHTHNVYLNVIIEMGVIGGLAYFYLIFKNMRRFWLRLVKPSEGVLYYGVWVAMMALLFACLTDIFIQQPPISLLFWISLGMMISLSNESIRNERV